MHLMNSKICIFLEISLQNSSMVDEEKSLSQQIQIHNRANDLNVMFELQFQHFENTLVTCFDSQLQVFTKRSYQPFNTAFE